MLNFIILVLRASSLFIQAFQYIHVSHFLAYSNCQDSIRNVYFIILSKSKSRLQQYLYFFQSKAVGPIIPNVNYLTFSSFLIFGFWFSKATVRPLLIIARTDPLLRVAFSLTPILVSPHRSYDYLLHNIIVADFLFCFHSMIYCLFHFNVQIESSLSYLAALILPCTHL